MNANSYCVLASSVIYFIVILTFLILEKDPYTDVEFFSECDFSDPCVNVCPADVEIYSDTFLSQNFPFDQFPFDNDTKFTRYPMKCSAVEKILYADNQTDWDFSFDGEVEYEGISIKHSKYCIDPVDKKWTVQMCVTDHPFLKFLHYLLLFIAVSLVMIPLIVYLSFPELRDGNGKLCIALLASQAFILAIIPLMSLSELLSESFSVVLTVIIYIGSFSSNFCMNAMCFDIYLTFKHFREPNYHSKYFKVVCIIVGCVILLLASAIVFLKMDAYEIFFYIIFIFIMSYFVFFFIILLDIFILAAALFHMVHIGRSSDTSENTRYDLEKERYWVYVKLFAILLIMWTIEAMTWSMHMSYESEVIADIIKAFSAALIAYLLLWKPKVYNLIFKRYKTFNNDADSVINV